MDRTLRAEFGTGDTCIRRRSGRPMDRMVAFHSVLGILLCDSVSDLLLPNRVATQEMD